MLQRKNKHQHMLQRVDTELKKCYTSTKSYKRKKMFEYLDEYKKTGEACPHCGANELEFIDEDIRSMKITYELLCNSCGKLFTEYYELTGVKSGHMFTPSKIYPINTQKENNAN